MNRYPVNYFEDPDADDDDWADDVYFEGDGYEYAEFDAYTVPISDLQPLPVDISPGCITMATLAACAALIFFLLKLAAGINIPAASAAIALGAQTDPATTLSQAAQQQNPNAIDKNAPVSSSSEASKAACTVSGLFPNKVLRWCSFISYYAARHSLNPDLLAALIWLESGGNEIAYSKSGAVGLMQVMPSDGLAASFMCVNGPCFSDRPSTTELQDPEFNIAYGTRMLAGLVRRNGNLREALRSYGPMNVGYYYSDKVLGIFEKYRTSP